MRISQEKSKALGDGSPRTKPQPNHKCNAAAARRCRLQCLSGAL